MHALGFWRMFAVGGAAYRCGGRPGVDCLLILSGWSVICLVEIWPVRDLFCEVSDHLFKLLLFWPGILPLRYGFIVEDEDVRIGYRKMLVSFLFGVIFQQEYDQRFDA